MTPEKQLELYGYGLWFFLIALPLLIVVLAGRFRRFRSRFLRFCLGVIIPWITVQDYDTTFIRPLLFRLARARGDMYYDGVGAGAAVSIIGLILPALVALLALGVEAIILHRRSPTDAIRSNTKDA